MMRLVLYLCQFLRCPRVAPELLLIPWRLHLDTPDACFTPGLVSMLREITTAVSGEGAGVLPRRPPRSSSPARSPTPPRSSSPPAAYVVHVNDRQDQSRGHRLQIQLGVCVQPQIVLRDADRAQQEPRSGAGHLGAWRATVRAPHGTAALRRLVRAAAGLEYFRW
ncbi:hypothetical protein B0H14DRAFT_291389 [Mycena olivaceomarginata]|nr:hypothetical protein B0H14DRAFT_291389 [Mycena olivaceomarginata]